MGFFDSHPYDALYKAPTKPFDLEYARWCENNFGMGYRGAQTHYELMKLVPEGYKYHRKLPRAEAPSYLDVIPGALVIDGGVCTTLDGQPHPTEEDWVLLVKPIQKD